MNESINRLAEILREKYPDSLTSIQVHVFNFANEETLVEFWVHTPDEVKCFTTPKELNEYVRGESDLTIDTVLDEWGLL